MMSLYNRNWIALVGAVVLVAAIPLFAFSQDRTTSSSNEDGMSVEQLESTQVIVCDGVTCPDGSCAATRDECSAEATISPDIYAHDDREQEVISRPQDESTNLRERDVDSIRLDETGSRDVPARDEVAEERRLDFRDVDSDGDSIPTQMERSPTDQSTEAANRTDRDTPPEDSSVNDRLEEREDIIRPAKDYNSTRSNRRKNVFFNPDEWDESEDDEDGIVTIPRERLAMVRDRIPEIRCGADTTVRDEGGLWCWGHGVRAAATGEGDADGTIATSTRVLQYLSVRGEDVRTWSMEERAQFREYKDRVSEAGTPERLTAEITELVLNDERIAHITITDTETTVRYRAQVRLFGVIPLEREVTARGTDTEDLSIEYPWYRFLSSTPDTDTIRSLFSSLSARISAGGGAGKATFQDF